MVQYLVGAGFYVIPAYMPADNSADQIVAANPDVYARNWANLWTAITEVPTFNSTLRGGYPHSPVLQPCSHAPAVPVSGVLACTSQPLIRVVWPIV